MFLGGTETSLGADVWILIRTLPQNVFFELLR
jgi:hypothetical protein